MQCTDLDGYLEQYGDLLGRQAHERLAPLHVPGRDPVVKANWNRPPLEAQAHAITAMVKHLKRSNAGIIAAEMGTGKSTMGAASLHAVAVCRCVDGVHREAEGRPYRGILLCPPHLVTKWPREIEQTIPGAKARAVDHFTDLIGLPEIPDGVEWWVLSEVAAKLGPSWKPSCAWKRVGEVRTPHCPTCGSMMTRRDTKQKFDVPISFAEMKKSRQKCGVCESPAWQWTHDLDKWPVALYIRQKLRRHFRYLIVDECHQYQSESSARSQAFTDLMCVTKKAIILTGTLAGGYAEDLRSLLFRLDPRGMVEEGLGWSDTTKWNERYGRIETTTVTTESRGVSEDNSHSIGKKKSTTRKVVKPGIMPTLFGRHLLDKTVFLSLDQVADDLPPFSEQIHECVMDAEQAGAYEEIERELTKAVQDMLRSGNRKLLGKMLMTLLGYPDHPYGYGEIGYMDDSMDPAEWISVVTCPDLSETAVRPKEKAFCDYVEEEVWAGRKVWGYVQMSETRDVMPRLESLLAARGLRVGILRAKKVATTAREAWIAKTAPKVDVILSHPKVVETGVDFFDKARTYNVPSIAFYQSGYSVYTLRQAARRAWRIAQWEPCRVAYFYYQNTMQARAMSLLAKKTIESELLEGKFSAAGLSAMCGDEDTLTVALAKSLVNRLDDMDPSKHWEKVNAMAFGKA